jgi:hypothetical protein
MAKPIEKFVVYNLRETYHELGQYDVKIVLSPRYFKNSHGSHVDLVDSSGNRMKYHVENWGRKINIKFFIDSSVADGVSKVQFSLKTDKGDNYMNSFSFWIIKP